MLSLPRQRQVFRMLVANYLEFNTQRHKETIILNQNFFDKLKIVKSVVIIGWSAGDVDITYLQKIIKSVNPDAHWTVYWYDDAAYNSLTKAFQKRRHY